MHAVNNDTGPTYIADITTPISTLPGHRRLISAATNQYEIPLTRSKFGDRAFSVAGPREWNSLPEAIRNITDVFTFKRATKIHFFLNWHLWTNHFWLIFTVSFTVRRL